MTPLVSVIVPLRAGDSLIPECLAGIKSQTFQDFELIIEQSEGNANVNRNAGFEKSSGEYLFFLDADIELKPNALKEMLKALEKSDAAYAYCDYDKEGVPKPRVLPEDERAKQDLFWHEAKRFSAKELKQGPNYISTMSLIKRECFPGWDEQIQRYQDYDLWLTMLAGGHEGVYVNKTLFTAHYKPGDLTMQGNFQYWEDRVKRKHTEFIDIIIPTFNQSDYTIRCLESVHKHTTGYRVIWIDNGSDKEEVRRVERFLKDKKMPYRAIKNPENLGFVKATNQGIATATGDVVLMNNDTEMCEGWLDALRNGIYGAGYDMMGPLARDNHGDGYETSWQNIRRLESAWGVELPEAPGTLRAVSTGMLAFFCVYITRHVIEKLGYLSEAFGVGFGDDDYYCQLAHRAGIKLGLATDVVIFHNHRTTFRATYPDDYKQMQVHNQHIYREKMKELETL